MGTDLEVIDINSREVYHIRNSGNTSRRKNVNRYELQKKRERQRKRELRRKRICYFLGCVIGGGILAIIFLITNIVKDMGEEKELLQEENSFAWQSIFQNEEKEEIAAASYSEIVSSYAANTPRTYENYEEIIADLQELAVVYPEAESIYENANLYPERLLKALCNNPEMMEFVTGYLESDKQENGNITKEEMNQKCPLFLQWDKRWGYEAYGESMIAVAGCGPTCLSMVIVALTDDASITPAVVADYSMKNNYYVFGTGTAWALLSEGGEQFGVHATEIEKSEESEERLKKELDNGRILICSMGPGVFTAGGHFVVIYDYNEEGFLINDPNCVARSLEHWSYSEISGQIKKVWAYSAK